MRTPVLSNVAVLTSGGDAPGMNAAIRAVVRSGAAHGIETIGIRRGYAGLCQGELTALSARGVGNILQRGGTCLETSRHQDMKTPEGRQKAIATLKRNGIEGLVIIGGDGTLHGAAALARDCPVPIMCVPSTIDNDVYGTDYTIGFDTAVNTAVSAIDRIRDTAESLPRLFFIEVMGREHGFLALEVAIACGADDVLIPEVHRNIDVLCKTLTDSFRRGKISPLVVVAEGEAPGGAVEIASEVKARLGIDYRVCVLGFIQRGGPPTARDRVLASKLGAAAVEALMEGRAGYLAGEVKGEIVFTPLDEAASKNKPLDSSKVQLASMLAI
ncbi:MAG: 6-phosphofructokinase [Chloroflexi bacterium]|nr:6-phosphofructokinase [Chloroflexota bacterium]